ncbi:DNA internalization-related competence protein ComEC/Rec2 [Methylotenera versatilis]|uniref:DNA internalization-related competence protein ComEC/Rec2 n=1 Tax=Methylotenera versatilis TaxID=1055487 RepID=UPI000647EC6B|nr:DNA internalization-related competence protein ComEC/Rec2 [Methylotenera versatilis]
MNLFAIGFVLGAWLLQQQPALPSTYVYLAILPMAFLTFRIATTQLLLIQRESLFNSQITQFLKKLSLFICAILLGFYWAAGSASLRLSDELPKEWQQKSIELIGVIASLPEVTERGERFKFDVEKVLTEDATNSLKVPAHISLNFYRNNKTATPESNPPENTGANNYFHAGERWQFTVKLKRPHTTYNPHGFDFEAWALSENMRATGSINQKSNHKKLSNFVFKPNYIVEHFREKVGNRISNALINQPYAGVIRALVVGDDSQISPADWNVYLRTGTNHLMSISGLHITMLAGLAFAVTAFVWRRVPRLVMYFPTRKAATIAGLIIAVLYACLAGLSVPTQRTLFMLMTFALALLLGRNLAISRALSIALVVVVLIDPWAVIAPGFWLSFSAVVLIAYVSVGRLKTQHWLVEAVRTQWAITLGLLPLLIAMFGQASIISPLANALAIPVISLIVVPLSIVGSLLPIDFVLQAAHWVLDICMHGLHWLANLPMAVWQQSTPPAWAILVAVLGALWLLLPRGFPQRWLGLVLFLPLFFVKPVVLNSGEMQVSVLDVGQGLSVVIKTANHTFLYDAGSRYSAQSNAGSRIVVPYLRSMGVAKLNGFVVSHNDTDHSGGAASVLTQIPVGWLATSFDVATDMVPADFDADSRVKKHLKCFAGQRWRWDGVDFQVLYPSRESYQHLEITDNNRSCVIRVNSAFGSLLLAGDIEKKAEAELLRMYPSQLASDVLIVPHHGSKTSSTLAFIQAVGAKHAIFTVGYLNRFKHPKDVIEKRHVDAGAVVYRSDYNGAVLLDFMAGKPLKIDTWRQVQPRYWHDRYEGADLKAQN